MFKLEHTLYLSFLLIGQATENKVKIENWRRIVNARQFIFFTQPLARVQFKPELPFLSFFCLEKLSARVQIRTHALPFFFIF